MKLLYKTLTQRGRVVDSELNGDVAHSLFSELHVRDFEWRRRVVGSGIGTDSKQDNGWNEL